MAPPKRASHRAKPSAAEPQAQEWWVTDSRIFVPVSELTGVHNIIDKRLPLSLRNALQRYAQELARKGRDDSAKKGAKEQVESRRRPRRKGRKHHAPGLMDVILAGRCLSK